MAAYYVQVTVNKAITQDEFVKRYSASYYLGSEKLVPGASQSSHFIEDQIDGLLKNGIKQPVDVARILAWKLGKIKHADSEKAMKFVYADDWAEAERLVATRYGEPFELKKIAEYVAHNISELEEKAQGDPQGVLNDLHDQGIKYLGPVYMVTLLYFISRGKYPIYDRFAAMAINAIQNDAEPLESVNFNELPGKDSKQFELIMNNYILPYKKQLEDVFGEGCCKNRDVDRALWVYGHYFS